MRIALVGPVYPFRGGIAHYTTMLARELKQAGHDVLVVSFRRQYPAWAYPGQSDRDPSREPLAVEGTAYSLDLMNPLTWVQTAGLIREYAPQVVVLQWWSTVWAPAWRILARTLRRAPAPALAFICHNVLPHEQRPWDAKLARSVLGMADRIVVASEEEKAALLVLLPAARTAVVPHPVYDMLADPKMTRQRARSQLGLPTDAPVLLYFGLVREYKGVQHLIDAMPRVRAAFPDVRLLIVGEFWQDKRPYLQKICGLGIEQNVIIVDRYVPNEEVPLYFAVADVVTLPYVEVTQSGVVQLAFGFGRPVITTQVGSLPEVVREGENGMLVEPRNPAALATAIVSYLRGDIVLRNGERLPRISKRGWDELVQAVTQDLPTRAGVEAHGL